MAVTKSDENIAHPAEAHLDSEKGNGGDPHAQEVYHSSSNDGFDSDHNEFQEGVQRVRAITTIWSKSTLWSFFALLYLISFVDYLQNGIDSSLNPYITSSFGAHGLLNIASILSTIIGGVIPLTIAKVIDIWGRVQGFVFMLTVCVIGMILKATCQNIETYVAGSVMYWTGHIGVLYVIEVMLSDITTLRNRMILIGLSGTPRIASTFASAPIGQLFYTHSNFRWAFGAFAFILVGCSMPAMGLMVVMSRKAKKEGLMKPRAASGRTWIESFKHYAVQFDLFGIFLISAALSFLLLPFSLAAYAPNGWSTGYIIAMIVLGVLFIPAFYIWERNFAPVQFLPFKYLKQGTIIGSCLLYGIMFLSTFTWNGYYYSYLLVVHRQSITNALYILNAYSLTATFTAPIIGGIISWTGDFKWTAYTGVPIMLLGTALLIPYRSPDASPGVLAVTQLLVGLGSSFFTTCSSIAIMAPVTHQEIAVVNALAGLFGGVGAAIGYAIAGGLWNNILPVELNNRLPEAAKETSRIIFANITMQMEFADGTPERQAIVDSYAHVMRLMVITGACLMPLCVLSIFVWKNINIRKIEEERGKQTKGNVF
uniref:Major facilitator superfamily (MFS) profile domain-containing protein n=1 Tax=Bionectria ochroleuca TaxID=29856 RepID=A0A8H7K9Z9_BIOOC